MLEVTEGLGAVLNDLHRYVIGHDDIKEAILLGLIAREHIYLEGPPGTAKTMLAELTADCAGLNFYFYQLHRDTRLAELVGDIVIARERSDSGELIRQSVKKGGILTAEISVLDDISRAPGEALNVLLRILNERKFGNEKIPLLTAIATSNPQKDEYYNEPLDPANLDRFTIQMKTRGLIQNNKWEKAMEVIDLYTEMDLQDREIKPRVDRGVLDKGYTMLKGVKIPQDLKEALISLLSTLVNEFKLDETNSLITDRTFLVKALKIIKGKALLSGRTEATLEDMKVLKYLTAFRVPPEVHEQIEKLCEEMIKKKREHDDLTPDLPSDGEDQEEEQMGEAYAQLIDDGSEEEADETTKALQQNQSYQQVRDLLESTLDEEDKYVARETVENIDLLLKKIKGEIEKSIADQVPHRGGQPRRWRAMKTLDEMIDADALDGAIWGSDPTPMMPRVQKREKRASGGEIAIIRDISSSMMGRYSKWASSVILGLIQLAQQKRMRVGYVEFNHLSTKFLDGGKFFSRNYEMLNQRAMSIKCFGYTNYERTLNDALAEFSHRGRHNNKHIVFLTDGVPTQGDWEVKEARKLAKQYSVAIHSIFIGNNECPKILEVVSEETDGSQFQASTDFRGVVTITERSKKIKRDKRVDYR